MVVWQQAKKFIRHPVIWERDKWLSEHAGICFHRVIGGRLSSKSTGELKYIRKMLEEKIHLAWGELSINSENRTALIAIVAAVIAILALLFHSASLSLTAFGVIILVGLGVLVVLIAISNIGIRKAAIYLEKEMLQCDEMIISRMYGGLSGNASTTPGNTPPFQPDATDES